MNIARFYCPQDHTTGNALLNWTGRPVLDLVTYAETYRTAACRLVHTHRELNINALDHHALPVLFLYRHSFELLLKAIIYFSATISISESEIATALPRLWREHSLVRLYAMAAPVLQESRPTIVDAADLSEAILSMSRLIDDIDPGSYSFRYPITTTGQASLPNPLLTNIFLFSDAIEVVISEVLDVCRGLGHDSRAGSRQMKLALHGLVGRSAA